MTFEQLFRASSQTVVACGALSLFLAGGMGTGLSLLFAAILITAWKLEGTKWQLSERVGLVVVLLALPVFYVDWKLFGNTGDGGEGVRHGVSALVHLTLFLSSVKLLQIKTDRDWLFIYIISFFQVLLAAGLNNSPSFLAILGVYIFCTLLTVVCFELRKARRHAPISKTRLLTTNRTPLIKRLLARRSPSQSVELHHLPLTAFGLMLLIIALALPIFFITPRLSENALAHSGGGATGYVGFSDTVTLGDIGRLQQNTRLVMRVRIDDSQAERNRGLLWRGVALDMFDGHQWTKSTRGTEVYRGTEKAFFQLGTTEGLERLTTQTFFIEPIDTPVLFVAPRVVALQGALPFVARDREGALMTRWHPQERITYRAYSDTVEVPPDVLRADALNITRAATMPAASPSGRYLQVPDGLDPRVGALAREVINNRGAVNRYDAAHAVEAHLRGSYRYTLEMRAGGTDPLTDFLFRVRAGHCEYFSTAMAIMLRSQGIATRVVNGFQIGEYNEAADAYTVRQSDAHSWVEVYFPMSDSWVSFDPTPAAGRLGGAAAGGARTQLNKYAEALELLWIQYVVAYDKQEQRSLVTSMRGRLFSYSQTVAQAVSNLKSKLRKWWQGQSASTVGLGRGNLPTDDMLPVLLVVILTSIALFIIGRRRGLWARRGRKISGESAERNTAVAFYERMLKALEGRGMRRAADQTPLEFALATQMPEALRITRAYHSVRYGARPLSPSESLNVEEALRHIERMNDSSADGRE